MLDHSLYTTPPPNCQNVDNRNYDPEKPRLKDLFWNQYSWLEETYKNGMAREVVFDTVQKALLCNTYALGYDLFECPNCGNFNIVYHKCHSRLCSSCGVKYQKQLALRAETMCLDVHHRHIVFTIPEEFRIIFRKDRSALDLLFIAARNTIVKMANRTLFNRMKSKQNKTGKLHNDKDNLYLFRNYKDINLIGMIATLHTFGRDLKWNPHIHCLVPELIYDTKRKKIKKLNYFDYESLRKTFQYEVCYLITLKFKDTYKLLTSNAYRNQYKGFYVYAKAALDKDAETTKRHSKNVKGCVNYMMRYASRPAMAESRLISYDQKNDSVRWYYEDHKTEQRVEVTESGLDLFKRIIIHIPEKNFQMIRYYGFYSHKNHALLNELHRLLESDKYVEVEDEQRKTFQEKLKEKKRKLKCRTMMLDSFNRDILKCPCGCTLVYVESYEPLEGQHNDREYRKRCIDEMRKMWIHRKSARIRSRDSKT